LPSPAGAAQVERPKLLPFRHDDQRIRAKRAGMGTVAKIDSGQLAPRLIHAGGIVGWNGGALIEQSGR
jgi:hypothetical protein